MEGERCLLTGSRGRDEATGGRHVCDPARLYGVVTVTVIGRMW